MEPEEPQEQDQEQEAIKAALNVPSGVRQKLLKARMILISGEVNQKLAERVMGELLALSTESDEDITVMINSQGGHVESGDTIHDMIKFVTPKVKMVGTGWVASAGALIYVSVPKERRFCLPNTRFLLHQPMGGVRGQGSDIAIEAEQIVLMRSRLNQIFADATGQSLEKIEKDTVRNFWLDPQEAIDYGLVGNVVQHQSELKGK